ncbi:LLM class flavin-dependent oxidoreductase [Kribbella voronezhensis]|uniref:LLM class flavin-dependent oxidoreductase n=1 Tax=Kribbella voronezhensis TaxID=2512212 RepID=UPI0010627535|nr:LLM class flavin-dependent oxidoreductase [Kribbella voronezhensis]
MVDQLRVGVSFPPAWAPERFRAFVAAVEDSGLDDLWISEDCFNESAIASAVTALAMTERIRVGAAILPVPLRNVTQSAMEIATIDRLYPGRFVAGIGHGVQPWMEQAGVRADAPLTLLSEYATALRQLLNGETVTTKGRYVQLTDVTLAHPPTEPPPLLIGVAGPKSLAAAGELGTGTLLALGLDTDAIKQATRTTLEKAGKDHEVIASIPIAIGPNARARVDAELAEYGMKGTPEIGAVGNAEEIADRLKQIQAAGATTISVLPCRDEPDFGAFARFLGQEVKPLLQS